MGQAAGPAAYLPRHRHPPGLLLLAGVLWLTITGANYPSQLLSDGLFWVQDRLSDLFAYLTLDGSTAPWFWVSTGCWPGW